VFLAGHTHGGHLATPFGPIVVPHGRLCREVNSGARLMEGSFVYVSRGIGGVEVPVRTFAPPDVLALDLQFDAALSPEP
jgi:uncharacterized protein